MCNTHQGTLLNLPPQPTFKRWELSVSALPIPRCLIPLLSVALVCRPLPTLWSHCPHCGHTVRPPPGPAHVTGGRLDCSTGVNVVHKNVNISIINELTSDHFAICNTVLPKLHSLQIKAVEDNSPVKYQSIYKSLQKRRDPTSTQHLPRTVQLDNER